MRRCRQREQPTTGEAKKPAGDDIVVGILADLTGRDRRRRQAHNEGMLAYYRHLNSQGGIKGRKINALSEDYA